MAQSTKYDIFVKIESFKFYQTSGTFYATAKATKPYILNNEIIIEKFQRVAVKFSTKTKNFRPFEIFEHASLTLSCSELPEKGSNAYTSATVEADEISAYEDRVRTISPAGL